MIRILACETVYTSGRPMPRDLHTPRLAQSVDRLGDRLTKDHNAAVIAAVTTTTTITTITSTDKHSQCYIGNVIGSN